MPGFALFFRDRPAQAVLAHLPVLPNFPAGVVPKAHVNGSGTVFVQGRHPVFGSPDPHFPCVILQQGRDVGRRNSPHMLKRRTNDRKSVVSARPDIALAVFKQAVEFCGRCFIDRCIIRFFQIHRPDAIRASGPEAAFAVCKEPGMGYWKAAVQNDCSVFISIQKRCVVVKGVEFTSSL